MFTEVGLDSFGVAHTYQGPSPEAGTPGWESGEVGGFVHMVHGGCAVLYPFEVALRNKGDILASHGSDSRSPLCQELWHLLL